MASKLILSVFAAVAFAAGSANAVSLTPVVTLDTGLLTTELNSNLSLPTFNSALGTLGSVHITETGLLSLTSGSVTNHAASTETFRFGENSLFTFSSGTALDGLLTSLNPIIANQQFTLAPGASAPITPSSNMASSGELISTDPSILALFNQPGPAPTVNVSTLTGQQFLGGGGNIAASVFTSAEGTLAIQFDYTAAPPPPSDVPEPASLALLGTGLAGLAFLRRRSS